MDASAADGKGQLREKIKEKLSKLSETEKQRQSNVIISKVLETDEYKKSKRVSVFLSLPHEVKTEQILREIFASDRECFIPHIIGPTMKMVQLSSWKDYELLPRHPWKIKQPRDDDIREDAIDKGGLDLIIVPGLAFTMDGVRLGCGRGYYTCYLKSCQQRGFKPTTFGLAYTDQICDYIPFDPETDMLVDMVLST